MELAWTQLQRGRFQQERRVFEAGEIRIAERRFNLAFKGEGETGSRSLFGVIADPTTSSRWFGLDVGAGDVAVTGSEVDVSSSDAGAFYTISFDAKTMARATSGARLAFASIEARRDPQLKKNPAYVNRLRYYLHQLFEVEPPPAPHVLRTSVERMLLPVLAAAVDDDAELVEAPRALSRRIRAVRECQEYMREHIGALPTLLELSAVCGLRPRSLINAFEAVTGSSPMAFLKAERLSCVHHALLHSDRRRTRIIDVATEWGFWHMAHFAESYRAMFGEAPSDTLRGSNRTFVAIPSSRGDAVKA